MACPVLVTERLLLREWRDAELDEFAAINADPRVMEFFPETYAEERTGDSWNVSASAGLNSDMAIWAVERKNTGRFIGYIGLWPATFPATFPANFTMAVEVGWRLAADQWGHGYATEGARAALNDGFDTLGLEEIVSFTSALNGSSIRVMERLGMRRDAVRGLRAPERSPGPPHPTSRPLSHQT